MEVPDAAMVRTWTPAAVDYAALGYGEAEPDPLQDAVDLAVASVRRYTGWSLADVPAEDEPLFRRATMMLTYLNAAELTVDRLDTLADFDLLKSFGAGSYNETRRGPEEMLKARMLVPWGALNMLLWDLMTPEAQEKWDTFFDNANGDAPVAPYSSIDFDAALMTGESDLDVTDPWV